jgi:cell division protein FtsL
MSKQTEEERHNTLKENDKKYLKFKREAKIFMLFFMIAAILLCGSIFSHYVCIYQDNKTKKEIVKNGYFKYEEKIYSIKEYDKLTIPEHTLTP